MRQPEAHQEAQCDKARGQDKGSTRQGGDIEEESACHITPGAHIETRSFETARTYKSVEPCGSILPACNFSYPPALDLAFTGVSAAALRIAGCTSPPRRAIGRWFIDLGQIRDS